jgi:hypothetical protein
MGRKPMTDEPYQWVEVVAARWTLNPDNPEHAAIIASIRLRDEQMLADLGRPLFGNADD